MNIYVGNLDYGLNEAQLEAAFAKFGEVTSAKIIYDRITQRSKGFGFVEMANDEEAEAAIEGLNGTELNDRELVVNKARPPRERSF